MWRCCSRSGAPRASRGAERAARAARRNLLLADECQLDAGQLDASAVIAAVRVGKGGGTRATRLVGVAFVDVALPDPVLRV